MKILLFSIFLCLGGTSFVFAENAQPPKFATLKDALVFIDHALDTADWSGLSSALYPPLQPNEPNRTYWTQLKEARGNLRLTDDFSGQDFPAADNEYVIKVPRNVTMGGSRIRFIKVDDSWCIKAVYIVR
jgi:hypothetical protein